MAANDYEESTREMLCILRDEIRVFKTDFDNFKREVTNHLAHRLPLWASMFMSALTFVVGLLVTAILKLI